MVPLCWALETNTAKVTLESSIFLWAVTSTFFYCAVSYEFKFRIPVAQMCVTREHVQQKKRVVKFQKRSDLLKLGSDWYLIQSWIYLSRVVYLKLPGIESLVDSLTCCCSLESILDHTDQQICQDPPNRDHCNLQWTSRLTNNMWCLKQQHHCIS